MLKLIKQPKIIGTLMVIGILGCMSFVSPALATVPGNNQIVSLSYTGGKANGNTMQSLISANGKAVVYETYATNIFSTGGYNIAERNLATGNTVRIDVSTSGVISNASSSLKNVSATGRYVLFTSYASNLIDGSTISTPQMYLRDTVTSTTTLITQATNGTLSNGTRHINGIGVSSDGRFVAFVDNATNLVPDVVDGNDHVYLLDRVNNTLTLVDRKTDGTPGTSGPNFSLTGSMSCDGSMVVFASPSALINGTGSGDLILFDRRGEVGKLTNITASANYHDAGGATISCNGDFIGFSSIASNLDPSVALTVHPYASRAYVYDRVNDAFHFVGVSSSGSIAFTIDNCRTGGYFTNTKCVSLSDTGLTVFTSQDPAFGVAGRQVYMRNIYSNTTQLLTQNSSGTPGNDDHTYNPTISADGRVAAYVSASSNLVSGDTNDYMDAFTSMTGE